MQVVIEIHQPFLISRTKDRTLALPVLSDSAVIETTVGEASGDSGYHLLDDGEDDIYPSLGGKQGLDQIPVMTD